MMKGNVPVLFPSTDGVFYSWNRTLERYECCTKLRCYKAVRREKRNSIVDNKIDR